MMSIKDAGNWRESLKGERTICLPVIKEAHDNKPWRVRFPQNDGFTALIERRLRIQVLDEVFLGSQHIVGEMRELKRLGDRCIPNRSRPPSVMEVLTKLSEQVLDVETDNHSGTELGGLSFGWLQVPPSMAEGSFGDRLFATAGRISPKTKNIFWKHINQDIECARTRTKEGSEPEVNGILRWLQEQLKTANSAFYEEGYEHTGTGYTRISGFHGSEFHSTFTRVFVMVPLLATSGSSLDRTEDSQAQDGSHLLNALSVTLVWEETAWRESTMNDFGDWSSPLYVTNDECETYKALKIREEGAYTCPGYLAFQEEVTDEMRSVLVGWLVEVHEKSRFSPETLYLTVNLLDRYLALAKVKRGKLQLVGIASLLLASKYEEDEDLADLDDLVYYCDGQYTKPEVRCLWLLAELQKVTRVYQLYLVVTFSFLILFKFSS